jgi:hypothetical protein
MQPGQSDYSPGSQPRSFFSSGGFADGTDAAADRGGLTGPPVLRRTVGDGHSALPPAPPPASNGRRARAVPFFLFLLRLGAPNPDLLRRIAGTDQPLTLASSRLPDDSCRYPPCLRNLRPLTAAVCTKLLTRIGDAKWPAAVELLWIMSRAEVMNVSRSLNLGIFF